MHVNRRTLEAAPAGMSPLDHLVASRLPARRRTPTHIHPVAEDNRPTKERASHNEIRSMPASTVGDARVRLVEGAVEAMYRRREIGDDERNAAERWYRDYATGVMGGRDPVEGRSTSGADAHDAQIARIDAVSRCAAVRAAVGFCGEVRLKAVVFDQLTLVAAAERLLPGKSDAPRRLAAQITLLLQQLAEYYSAVDRAHTQRKRLTERTEAA